MPSISFVDLENQMIVLKQSIYWNQSTDLGLQVQFGISSEILLPVEIGMYQYLIL